MGVRSCPVTDPPTDTETGLRCVRSSFRNRDGGRSTNTTAHADVRLFFNLGFGASGLDSTVATRLPGWQANTCRRSDQGDSHQDDERAGIRVGGLARVELTDVLT
jgi:hypothetical protein